MEYSQNKSKSRLSFSFHLFPFLFLTRFGTNRFRASVTLSFSIIHIILGKKVQVCDDCICMCSLYIYIEHFVGNYLSANCVFHYNSLTEVREMEKHVKV